MHFDFTCRSRAYLVFIKSMTLLVQMSGKVMYNGYDLEEFTPQRTSAYASQQDWHIPEMTVREVLEFSGQCQGAGFKHGNINSGFQLILKEFFACMALMIYLNLVYRNSHGTS